MTLNAPTFALQQSQKQEREEGPEKIFEEIRAKNFTNTEKEIVNQVQETQRSRQHKP